jgi:hypothetical protein
MAHLVGIHLLQFLALLVSKAVIARREGHVIARRRWQVVVLVVRDVVEACIAVPEPTNGTR